MQASDRPGWRAPIHRSVEEFESNQIKHQQLKQAVRIDDFEAINIQSGEGPTCSLCGRLSLHVWISESSEETQGYSVIC